jgi:hypothetical protein
VTEDWGAEKAQLLRTPARTQVIASRQTLEGGDSSSNQPPQHNKHSKRWLQHYQDVVGASTDGSESPRNFSKPVARPGRADRSTSRAPPGVAGKLKSCVSDLFSLALPTPPQSNPATSPTAHHQSALSTINHAVLLSPSTHHRLESRSCAPLTRRHDIVQA